MEKNIIHDDLLHNQSSRVIRHDSTHLFTMIGVKSFGTITFRRNYSNRANFIRIPPDAPPDQVKEIFFQQRRHRHPSLVISVTGSAREYNMRSKLFRIFRQGLLKVAKTTNVWILTNGINTSITKLIGEIIRTNPDPSRPIHLIGIATWGTVAGVEQLDVQGTNVIYNKPKSDESAETPLEPNHSHFIFIDDGSKHQYGGEIQFRNHFEKSISGESFSLQNTTTDKSKQSGLDHIPVVLLVIEGGVETIKKVHENVVKNHIPVVFLEGTGGCCDLFAKCYHFYDEYHPKMKLADQINEDQSIIKDKNEQIKNKLREKLQIIDKKLTTSSTINLFDENDGIDYFELLYECIEKCNIFLNFIDFKVHNHLEPDVDLAILQALLNVTFGNDLSEINQEQKREQLNLAYQWKRIDIVKNFIMKDENDWKTIELNDLFEKALRENQIHFVQLFLDHDFPLNNLFENNSKLLTFYQNENYHLTNHLIDPLRAIYRDIIQPMIGDFFQIDAIFQADDVSPNCSSSLIDEMDVEKELFLWSVLTGKQELALLFWARGKNKVCAALIATLLYKSKAREEKDARYIEWADEFQNLSVQILEKFYLANPFECTQAIIRGIPQFGNVTWLHLAVMAEAKLFIAQKAIQDVLNDIWYGYIDHRVGNSIIILTSFCPLYGGFLPYHKELVEGSEQCNQLDTFDQRSNLFQRHSSRSNYSNDNKSDPACSKLMDHMLDDNDSIVINNKSSSKRFKSGLHQYIKNLFMFFQAPCVKYLYNLYFHMIFLMLFSYVILCDFFPLYDFASEKCFPSVEEHNDSHILIQNVKKRSISNQTTTTGNSSSLKFGLQRHSRPTTSELILCVWMFTLFCEEIRQIFAMEVQSIYRKLAAYMSVFWNQLDVLAIVLFFIAFVLRFLPMSECFCSARIILAIDLSIWYIRTLDMFSAIKRLGPKLVMIGEMVHDMKFFMLMLTVFVLAFGVPTHSLMYGVQKFSWHMPRTIINLAYWQIFGEIEVLDDIEKNYDLRGYIVFILLIAYMTVASVLLINLLIAMFSNTFDRLHLDTDCIWKFQHYSLVSYHLTRPSLPPPLVIFSHIYRFTIYIFAQIFQIKWFQQKYLQHSNRAKFKIMVDEMLTKKIEGIEDALGNEVYFFSLKSEKKINDHQNDLNEQRVHSPQEIVLNKIKILENQIQIIQNQQGNIFEYLEYLMNGMKKIGGDDIEMPKQSRVETELILIFWSSNSIECLQPYFPSQLVFSLDDNQTIYAIDQINQRAFHTFRYGSRNEERAFVMKHFPYAIIDSPQSKYYVQLVEDSPPLSCLYGTYWKYGGNTFNSFPSHWLNGTSFFIGNYIQFKYSMIYSNQSSQTEDYWYANQTCQVDSGEFYPCEEIFFQKNTDLPIRFTQVIRRGWIVIQTTTNYQILSTGQPDDKYFDTMPKNWSLICRDVMLGLLYYSQTNKINIQQSSQVQVWLITPPHRINRNDTVSIQWKSMECDDCLTWTPKELSFNSENFNQRQILTINRIKDGPKTTLQPIFNGGGFDLVLPQLYPIYIE